MGCVKSKPSSSKVSQEEPLRDLITEAVKRYAGTGAPADVRQFLADHFAASLLPGPAHDQGAIGIVRLDGANYSAPVSAKKAVRGDLAEKSSFEDGCEVFYERVEGYTFTACKYGLVDPNAAEPVMEKEGIIDIRAPPGDAAHLFVPNRRGGAANEPRPRKPSRTEDLLDDSGAVVGTRYVYDSATMLANIEAAMGTLHKTCGATCIASACGFMGNLQDFCAEHSPVPCIMSSLELLPLLSLLLPGKEDQRRIVVITANSDSFNENFSELVKPGWHVADEVIILGLQDVDGFGDEVASGTTVDVETAAANILKKVREAMSSSSIPIKAIVSECTELPGYTNMLRAELRVPVFDAITAAGMLYNAIKPRAKYTFDPCYA